MRRVRDCIDVLEMAMQIYCGLLLWTVNTTQSLVCMTLLWLPFYSAIGFAVYKFTEVLDHLRYHHGDDPSEMVADVVANALWWGIALMVCHSIAYAVVAWLAWAGGPVAAHAATLLVVMIAGLALRWIDITTPGRRLARRFNIPVTPDDPAGKKGSSR